MNAITHAFVGIAISKIFLLDMEYAVIGAILPDIDYIIGVPHRTFTHSLVFLLIFLLQKDKRFKTIGIGILSHIILDIITIKGVMLFWPIQFFVSLNLAKSTDRNLNLIIIGASLILSKKKIKLKLFED